MASSSNLNIIQYDFDPYAEALGAVTTTKTPEQINAQIINNTTILDEQTKNFHLQIGRNLLDMSTDLAKAAGAAANNQLGTHINKNFSETSDALNHIISRIVALENEINTIKSENHILKTTSDSQLAEIANLKMNTPGGFDTNKGGVRASK